MSDVDAERAVQRLVAEAHGALQENGGIAAGETGLGKDAAEDLLGEAGLVRALGEVEAGDQVRGRRAEEFGTAGKRRRGVTRRSALPG